MSEEFSRLLADPDEAAVAGVLGSALDDAPSAGGVERAARSLGLAPAVALATTKAAAATAVTTGASSAVAGATLVPHVTHVAWATLAKWLGAGLLAGSITSLGVSRLPIARGESDAPPSSRAPSRGPSLPPPSEQPAAPATATTVAVAVARAPAIAAASAAGTVRVERREPGPVLGSTAAPRASLLAAPGAPPLPAPKSLERELARLDQARQAVNARDPDAALQALAAYDRELDAPTLRAEATLLRVQALVAKGKRDDAQREVRDVLRARPLDGYTCRLTRLAGLGDSGCGVAPAAR